MEVIDPFSVIVALEARMMFSIEVEFTPCVVYPNVGSTSIGYAASSKNF